MPPDRPPHNAGAFEAGGDEEESISISREASALATSLSPSLAGIVARCNLEVRDFIVLSFIADQGAIDCESLARMTGLDLPMTTRSVQTLVNSGFVELEGTSGRFRVTAPGRDIAKKVMEQI